MEQVLSFGAIDCLERGEKWAEKKGLIYFIGMADWDGQTGALEEDFIIKRVCPIRVHHPGYPRALRVYFLKERQRPKEEETF